MNNSDDQPIDSSCYIARAGNSVYYYDSSGALVRINPSDADNDYIRAGSIVKAFKTVLPLIILSLVLFIGASRVEDHFNTIVLLAAGCIFFLGSMVAFPLITGEQEEKRVDEVTIKNIKKYNQLHRE